MTRSSEAIDLILEVLAGGSLVAATLVAPNLVQVLGKSYLKKFGKNDRDREVRRLLRHMKRLETITIEEDGGYKIRITDKGKARFRKVQFDNLTIPAQSKWDGKWRLVIFDVPEKYGASRRALTEKLQIMGFKMLQKSVWVHPFPCSAEVEVVKNVYSSISPYLVLVESDNIETHNDLVRRFKNLLAA